MAIMRRAQDAYLVLLRDHVAPKLRALGFRGSRGAYTLPHPEYWVRIGIQSSAWNTGDHVDFTLNVTAIPKAGGRGSVELSQGISEVQPQANAIHTAPALGDNPDFWQSRIGPLLPAKTDRWWTLRHDSDVDAVAAQVMNAVREGALPAITRHTGFAIASEDAAVETDPRPAQGET